MQSEIALRALSFFSQLDDTLIRSIASIAYCRDYPAGFMLSYEQTESDRLLFLTQGLAKAYKIDKYDNEVFLYSIYPGAMLSEISSLDEEHLVSYANISIERDSTVLSIEYPRFKRSFLDNGLLGSQLSREILRQSKQLQRIIHREFVFDSISKVAMMLDEDLELFNQIKRHDVALMLHIQPATLSRVLKRLEREKIITIEKGNVRIADTQKLQNIYGGER